MTHAHPSVERDWERLPKVPGVPTLSFRHYRGAEDDAAIAGVVQAANDANDYFAHVTPQQEGFALSHLTNARPTEDVVLGIAHAEVVAVSRLDWFDTLSGERYYRTLGHVHPSWRRRGIGMAMLARNERRLGQVAATDGFDSRKTLVTWFPDGDVGAARLFEGRGYQRVRTYEHMVKYRLDDVPVVPFPEGLEARAATEDELCRIWDAMADGFRDHRGQADWGDKAFERWSQGPLMNLRLLLVVWDGDEIVACAQAAIDHDENTAMGYRRGWLERGFIRRESRSVRERGLPRAILPALFDAMRGEGLTSAQLRVDAANQFNVGRVYRKYGFEVVSSSSEWHKPLGS